MFEEVIESYQRAISRYEEELRALVDYEQLALKFERAIHFGRESRLNIFQLSEVLKSFFYLDIPKEKWFLISEIMSDLEENMNQNDCILEWPNLLDFLTSIADEEINRYLENFYSFLEDYDCQKLLSVDTKSFFKKRYREGQDSYYVSTILSLAIMVKENFRNIFENRLNYQMQQTTVEGVHKTFSFLLLYSLASPKIMMQRESLTAFTGLLALYNSNLEKINFKIFQKELELAGDNVFILRKKTPENVLLIEKFTEYQDVYTILPIVLEYISDYRNNMSYLKKRRKSIRHQIKILQELISFLEKDKEVCSIPSSIFQLEDLELQGEILSKIKKYNYLYAKNLSNQIQRYKKSDFESLATVFTMYRCDISNLSEQEVEILTSCYTIDQIHTMISVLDKSKLAWREKFNFIFTKSNLLRVKKLQSYLEKKSLTVDFLQSHIDYYDVHSDSFSNFEKILSIVEGLGIDSKNIAKKSSNLWQMECNMVQQNVDLYKKYGVDFSQNQQYDYDYLGDQFSFDLLDEWMELGFLAYARSHLYLLRRKNGSVGKKIRLMRELGFSVEDERVWTSCFLEQPFSDSDVEEYFQNDFVRVEDLLLEKIPRLTISKETLSLPIVHELDSKYLISEVLYEINGILVSRNRFLRNLEVLQKNSKIPYSEQILKAITFTPYCGYTKEELEILKKVFSNGKRKEILYPNK